MSTGLHIVDARQMAYRPAWALQLQLHDRVLAGEFPDGALMLVEHPPVITLGRRPGSEAHVLAPAAFLEKMGVEVVESDRGGDITYHGPGQLVAYPIVPLNHYGLNAHTYLRLLETVVMDVLADFGLQGERSDGATGVWVDEKKAEGRRWDKERGGEGDGLAKICAMGVKLRRWVTFHGLALNVTTDLQAFTWINPCGLSRPVTSMQRLLGERVPIMQQVKASLIDHAQSRLAEQRR